MNIELKQKDQILNIDNVDNEKLKELKIQYSKSKIKEKISIRLS